jgi:hypothetical protein
MAMIFVLDAMPGDYWGHRSKRRRQVFAQGFVWPTSNPLSFFKPVVFLGSIRFLKALLRRPQRRGMKGFSAPARRSNGASS